MPTNSAAAPASSPTSQRAPTVSMPVSLPNPIPPAPVQSGASATLLKCLVLFLLTGTRTLVGLT